MSGSMHVDRSTTVVRSTTSEPVRVAHPDGLVHDGDVVRLAHRFVSRSMGHRVGSRGLVHGGGPAHLVGHDLVHRVGHDPARVAPTSTPTTTGPRT